MEPLCTRETTAREIAGALEPLIARAHAHELEVVAYVLETARIEALRASRPAAPGESAEIRLRY